MLTNHRQESPAPTLITNGRGGLALWLKVIAWLSQVWCGLHGHDPLLQFERDRMFLRCTSCGHETPGWEIGAERRHLVFRSDTRLAAQPQIANVRRIA